MKFFETELKKNRRTANKKLIWITPCIFTLFSFLASLLMVPSSKGNVFIAGAYNWFPLIILPSIISLLVANSINLERKNKNIEYLKSKNVNLSKLYFYKSVIVSLFLFSIIIIAFFIISIVTMILTPSTVNLLPLFLANIMLFICCLPLIPVSYIIIELTNTLVLLTVNFIGGLLASIISTTSFWIIYPWSYSFRAIAPLLKINPNGTFIEGENNLSNINNVFLAFVLAIIFYLVGILVMNLISKRVFK
uniref:NsjE ABC2 membrane superfamily n=1 Tax=Staphylococcus capitis TaxID=29388 RepID=A0A650A8U1_STACP|nr:ABC transporter permease [Staphylococcus capitis]QGN18862.1 nsjE ABC2 membrane superfamily [Staphylococcus capitis]